MGSVKKINKIATDENLMEMAQHGSSQYSFRFYCDDLEQFDFHCIDWHWHTELEILYVESGSLTCYVGDKQIILKKGEGMFINSRVLHRFHAVSAIMPNFVFMPSFATVYKGNIIKNLIMDCQSYTKYRPNETTGGIFVSWRRKEELPTGA